MDTQFKKRHRVPASCLVCRKRKSRCDRVKPVCGLCKKKSIAHLCFYELEKSPRNDYDPQPFPQPGAEYPVNPSYDPSYKPTYIGPTYLPEIDQYNPGPAAGPPPPPPMLQIPGPPGPLHTHNHAPPHLRPQLPLPHHQLLPPPSHPQPTQLQPTLLDQTLSGSTIVTPASHSPDTPGHVKNEALELVPIAIGPFAVLHVLPYDIMDVFSNASYALLTEGPVWQNHGVFSYLGVMKCDPFCKVIRNFSISIFRSGKIAHLLLNGEKKTDKEAYNSDVEVESEEGDVVDEDGIIITRIQKKKESEHELIITPLSSKQQSYDAIKHAVLEILPSKRNQFILFCRFFKWVHPFVPVVDENPLLMDIRAILSGGFPVFSSDYYTNFTLQSDNELTTIGIFLWVLRLGYMSLFHNDELNNNHTADELSIIEDMSRFSLEKYTQVAQSCCPDFRTTSRSSFKLVQYLTLLHFYQLVSPNDGQGLSGCDSQILFGAIVKHAFSIGLNRDPSMYHAHTLIKKRAPLMKTWRHLWNYIANLDALGAIYSGNLLNIRSLEVCDVNMPQFDNKSGQHLDTFLHISQVCQSYRNICNLIANVRNKPRVVDLLMETSHLEKVFVDFYGKDFFKEYICKPNLTENPEINTAEHENSYIRVMKFITFLHLRTNLLSLYYMVAVYYESQYKGVQTPSINAGIELYKIHIRSVVQLMYIISYVLDNSVELFGKNYDVVLTSYIEKALIKVHNFLTSFFIRLLHQKRMLTVKLSTPGQDFRTVQDVKMRLECLFSIFRTVLVDSDLFLGNFRRMSSTYINSYRLYVMSSFVIKQCMENSDALFEHAVDDRFHHDGTNMIDFLTIADLQNLVRMVDEFKLAKAESSRRRESHSQLLTDVDDATELPPASVKEELDEGVSFNAVFDELASKMNLEAMNSLANEDIMSFFAVYDIE